MFRLIAIGDIHDSLKCFPLLAGPAGEADLVVLTGDLTTSGGEPAARRVLDAVKRLGRPFVAQVGNMDLDAVDRLLTAEGVNLHRRGRRFGDVGLFGVGGSNPTPFSTPTEFTEEEIARFLDEGRAEVADAPVQIAVPHMPPHATAVDRVKSGAHVGSRSVREFLESRRPALCLTGHIHEAVGSDRVGSTLVLNPGPFASGRYVDVRVEDHSVSAEIVRLV